MSVGITTVIDAERPFEPRFARLAPDRIVVAAVDSMTSMQAAPASRKALSYLKNVPIPDSPIPPVAAARMAR
ncbi:MAG TPA: hypothetical protein VN740_06755 [Solirubrobacteraceae bacterium]|nr:hypothetical protein [Solirubrobacteraceae bacterium]